MPGYEVEALIIMIPIGLACGGAMFSFLQWHCRKWSRAGSGQAAKVTGRIIALEALLFLVLCLLDMLQHRNPFMELNLAVVWATAYCGSWLMGQWRKA